LIVVDTSVWIAAGRKRYIAERLQQLIEEDEVSLALPVRLELWAGVPKSQRKQFLRQFAALPQLHPTEETWQQLPAWIETATDAGERFTISDLLIASMTAEIGGLVWSLDKDFDRMAALGFVSLYPAPA
jgi:predicted nucleic acid-binding protein